MRTPSRGTPARSQAIGIALAMAREAGHDVRPIMRRFGLPTSAEKDRELLLTLSSSRAILAALEELMGDPLFAIRLAERLPTGRYGLVEYVMHYSATLGDSLRALVKYAPLNSDVMVPRLEVGPRAFSFDNSIPGEPLALGQQANELYLALLLFRMRARTRKDFVPIRAWLAHPRASGDHEIARALGVTKLTFGTGRIGFELPRAALDWPIVSSDPTLVGYLVAHADSLLTTRRTSNKFLGHVKMTIREQLRRGSPSVDETARALRMSRRTFQRRLTLERATFRDLADGVLKDVACELLAQSAQSVTEIAFELRYTDVSSFSRAFRKWCGLSPASYRARIAR